MHHNARRIHNRQLAADKVRDRFADARRLLHTNAPELTLHCRGARRFSSLLQAFIWAKCGGGEVRGTFYYRARGYRSCFAREQFSLTARHADQRGS